MSIKKTVFLVDDDEDDLFLMGKAFQDLGVDVNICCASNGIQLLEMLTKDVSVSGALVLIDMNMPMMNGVETLRAVYANPDFKQLRSILMSTSDREELRKAALDSGAMNFICKPCHYDDYLQLMKDLFYKCF